MRRFTSLEELEQVAGELGPGDWVEITQERIDMFADATGDHQWIHVDPDRAADGPYGATIAHGFLTLSLVPFLASSAFVFDTPGAQINYGLNKVRFPNPVRVGKRVRDHVSIIGSKVIPAGRQVTLEHVIEIEGEDKPGCVAEAVVLLLTEN